MSGWVIDGEDEAGREGGEEEEGREGVEEEEGG